METRKTINDDTLKIELVKSFESGMTAPTNLYELYRTKYKLGKQRFLQIANTARKEWLVLKKQAQTEQVVESEKKAVKESVIGRAERQQILTQIALGKIPLTKPMVVDGKIKHVKVVPDWMDRKNAIAELNKMDGEYAPTKTELTGKDGKPLQVSQTADVDYGNLTEAELLTLKKLHDKAAKS